jgi:hypothetical protein
MTFVTEKKVERRVQGILKSRKTKSPSNPPSGATDLDKALVRFFEDYCPASSVITYNTSILHVLYERSTTSDCFKDALQAAALRSMANQLNLEQMAADAERAYGRALALAKAALANSTEVTKDTTLATLYLLGLYEVRMSKPNQLCILNLILG